MVPHVFLALVIMAARPDPSLSLVVRPRRRGVAREPAADGKEPGGYRPDRAVHVQPGRRPAADRFPQRQFDDVPPERIVDILRRTHGTM